LFWRQWIARQCAHAVRQLLSLRLRLHPKKFEHHHGVVDRFPMNESDSVRAVASGAQLTAPIWRRLTGLAGASYRGEPQALKRLILLRVASHYC
jgi:hypothetical protein